MIITPDSTITLYSGVDIGTDMQLAFSSATKQAAYFTTKVKKSYVNCTTVKDKIGVVRVAIKPRGQAGTGEITGADLASCNYMSFVNPSFDNKTIYCYIVDYKYLNNETAEISYLIDYWQTWMFDVDFQAMYIDREHLSAADWTKIETNPYDKTVPQMITEEPLPTPEGYEKPFYGIQWWHDTATGADDDALDGRALLHTESTMTANDAHDMLVGDWDYWNVMLVQAPTNWEYFNIDGNEEAIKAASFYKDLSDIFHFSWGTSWSSVFETKSFDGTFPSDTWKNVTVTPIAVGSTTSVTIVANNWDVWDQEATTTLVGYVYDKNTGKLWRNKSAYISATYDPTNPPVNNNGDFELVGFYLVGTSNAEQELNSIIDQYSIIVQYAGSQTATVNGQDLRSWSAKPRGCDILLIRDAEGWQELAKFYAKYNAVSQIVGIYGVPIGVIKRGYMNYNWQTSIGEDQFKTKSSAARTSLTSTGKQKTVKNKKLLTSPFSYYRVIAPNGQVKEYKYEDFVALVDTAYTSDIDFRIVLDTCGDAPKMYLIPDKYKVKNNLPASIKNALQSADTSSGQFLEECLGYNLDECICVDGFPQISFNTDGYLTFLGSEYAGITAERTQSNMLGLQAQEYETRTSRNTIPSIFGALGNVVSGVVNGGAAGGIGGAIAGGATGLAQGAYNVFDAGKVAEFKRLGYVDTKAKYDEAAAWSNGDLLSCDDPYSDRFNLCKPAYANSVYTGGQGGVISYLRGMGLFDFIGLHVQLREEILDYYDAWFDLYGYTSARCGIPYVIQWCRSSTGDTYANNHVDPHWVSGGSMDKTTYVKTKDCKVEHSMMPVANAIKQMFDKGIRFKKGDLS